MNRKLFGLVINAIYDEKSLSIYIEIVGAGGISNDKRFLCVKSIKKGKLERERERKGEIKRARSESSVQIY